MTSLGPGSMIAGVGVMATVAAGAERPTLPDASCTPHGVVNSMDIRQNWSTRQGRGAGRLVPFHATIKPRQRQLYGHLQATRQQ